MRKSNLLIRSGRTTWEALAGLIREVEQATGDTYLHSFTGGQNTVPIYDHFYGTFRPYFETAERAVANAHEAERLSPEGILEFGIEAGQASPVRGTEMFGRMMEHFGTRVRAVQGSWYYGDNLREVNKLTATGSSLEEAASRTWTGRRAAKHGYSRIKVLEAKGTPGRYTELKVWFELP